MKRATKKQGRARQAQETKVLFYRSANWRQSFVPLNLAFHLDLPSPIRIKGGGLIKRQLKKAKIPLRKAKQGFASPGKATQALKKIRSARLARKASGPSKTKL